MLTTDNTIETCYLPVSTPATAPPVSSVEEDSISDHETVYAPHTGSARNSSLVTTSSKRANVISWDEYFMSIAFLSAMRSKDPSTQVGACIVSPDKRIVGIGYNGFPRGCSDDELPWGRSGDTVLDTKYPVSWRTRLFLFSIIISLQYVVHAEVNAILNKNSADVNNCTVRRLLFVCLVFSCPL